MTLIEPGTLLLLDRRHGARRSDEVRRRLARGRSLGKAEAAFVGVGMVPRGEVGIIVAGIGEASGVIGSRVFALVVGMSILTTLLVPPVLRVLARRLPADDAVATAQS